jgi:hypothetical protein
MIIRCPVCWREFDKPSRRNQHVKDAHKTKEPEMTTTPAPGVDLATDERAAFEAAARKGLDTVISGFDFQRNDDDEYKWFATRRLYEFWKEAGRATIAAVPASGPVLAWAVMEGDKVIKTYINEWPAQDWLQYSAARTLLPLVAGEPVLVAREPTDDMLRAGVRAFQHGHRENDSLADWRAFYVAAAAAAPAPMVPSLMRVPDAAPAPVLGMPDLAMSEAERADVLEVANDRLCERLVMALKYVRTEDRDKFEAEWSDFMRNAAPDTYNPTGETK